MSTKHKTQTVSHPILSVIGRMLGAKVANGEIVKLTIEMLNTETLGKAGLSKDELGRDLNQNNGASMMVGCIAQGQGAPIDMAFMIYQFLESSPNIKALLQGMLKMDIDPEGLNGMDQMIQDLLSDN